MNFTLRGLCLSHDLKNIHEHAATFGTEGCSTRAQKACRHGTVLATYIHTGPQRLRDHFQVVSIFETHHALQHIFDTVLTTCTGPARLRLLFQIAQTQTTTAYSPVIYVLFTLDNNVQKIICS